eukprot:4408399-Pyramimonas_sp.AAC.1
MASDDELGNLAASQPSDDEKPCLASDSGDSDVEMTCIGCGTSSRAMCPVKTKQFKGKITPSKLNRISWGKTTKRGGARARISGEWCRICVNIANQWVAKKKRYSSKKGGKANKGGKMGLSLLKQDLVNPRDKSVKKRFKKNWKEWVNQRALGKVKVSVSGEE